MTALSDFNLITSSADAPTQPQPAADAAASASPEDVARAREVLKTLESDADFQHAEHNADAPGHLEAVRKVAACYRVIAGDPINKDFLSADEPAKLAPEDGLGLRTTVTAPSGDSEFVEPPPGPVTINGHLVHPAVADPLENAVVSEDQQKERDLLAVQYQLGPLYKERIGVAERWLGPEMLAAVQASGYADHAESIGEIVDLSEDDPQGFVRENLRRFLKAGIYHASAGMELAELEAETSFTDALYDSSHPKHELCRARVKALRLLETPSAWAEAMMKVFAAS